MYVYVFVRTYVIMLECAYVCDECMYACIYVGKYVYICMYVCMELCMHVRRYIYVVSSLSVHLKSSLTSPS